MTSGAYASRIFQAGQTVFRTGDRAAEAFLIRSGRVRIHVTKYGAEKEIDTVGPGRIFGEMAVLSDMNRMASATAVETTELVCCHRQELLRRLDDLPEFRQESFRFLISYSQDLMPHELMPDRPDDTETRHRDAVAYDLVENARSTNRFEGLDPFMTGLYRLLIGYAERRLPPNFKP